MRQVFTFDEDKCCACSACMVACMDQNDIDVEHGEQCYRRTYEPEFETKDGLSCGYFSMACMHCEDAPCIAACPSGCLRKDEETGFTVYDNTNCIGCKSCAMACPFGAPRYRRSDGKMVKCDGCNTRVKNGLKPACVRACPFGALDCVPEDKLTSGQTELVCNQLIRQFRPKCIKNN